MGNKPGVIYEEAYRQSVEDPEGFWGPIASELFWYQKWDRVLDDSRPPFFRWFVGGKTNICYNAIDRHALGSERNKAAVIWVSPEVGQSRTITYFELYREVNRFAAVLRDLGVKKGDRVITYLPMVPEAFIAMYACLRLGAVHSTVFAGFSVESLISRIEDAQPKVIITADGGIRRGRPIDLKGIVDQALQSSPVDQVVVLDRGLVKMNMKEGRDLDWSALMTGRGWSYVEPEQLDSSDPSYILYTSGTTGQPKGVVRDTGGYMVALYASMRQIYDAREEDVYWAASDIGWVVGHSYIIYAPLLYGITSVMYEGTPDYPDPGIVWSVVERYGVNIMFAAPTLMRMLKRFDVHYCKHHDITSLRYLFLAGEALDVDTYQWASELLGVPIIDHYWQTETGWPVISNSVGIEFLPVKPGSPGKPCMGYKLAVVDEAGNPVPPGTKGYLVFMAPLPPGCLLTLYRNDDWYRTSYWEAYPGKRLCVTGDYAVKDQEGYLFMLGRADEVLNVAGHRLGTREIEEVVASHPAVAEASVIGVADALKGEEPVAVVVLKTGYEGSEAIVGEIKRLVRQRIGPVATPGEVLFVNMVPKTRSGKVMRRVIRALYEGRQLADLSTLEDEASIEEVRSAVEAMGVSPRQATADK